MVATCGPVYDFVASLGDVRVLPDLEALPASARRDRVIEALRSVAVQPLSDEKAVQRSPSTSRYLRRLPPSMSRSCSRWSRAR